MPKLATPLTDIQPRTAKPKGKPYKLTDGGGLYLLLNPDGAKHWRMDYRFLGARRTLAFSKYPDVTLAVARAKRMMARKLLGPLEMLPEAPLGNAFLCEREGRRFIRKSSLAA